MFWKRKRSANEPFPSLRDGFEKAKEATRRAAFLNLAAKMSSDQAYKQSLAELFRMCRSAAITAGAALGRTEAEVDAEISRLCDSDTDRLKVASDKAFVEFAKESGAIVSQFLAASGSG